MFEAIKPTLHITNSDFELELAGTENTLLSPIALQLQFLPFLYADAQDYVAISTLFDEKEWETLRKSPWNNSPSYYLFNQPIPETIDSCISWGPSPKIALWAKKQGLIYDAPADISLIQTLNSKGFSHSICPLEGSRVIHNIEELIQWTNQQPGEKVLKACFGLSGQGNKRFCFLEEDPKLIAFCQKEWNNERPIIAEPWLNKVMDFSTQWVIPKTGPIRFIGATRFETSTHGTYQGTLAGPISLLFGSYADFVAEHKVQALKALSMMQKKGYFGPTGIDAFLYKKPLGDKIYLNPIVEINGRQTMSSAALKIQQKQCPEEAIRLSFKKEKRASLLPQKVILENGKIVAFKQTLSLEKWSG